LIKIYIECGQAFNASVLSGIQRTVINIVTSLRKYNKDNVKIFEVEFNSNGFFFRDAEYRYKSSVPTRISKIKNIFRDLSLIQLEFIRMVYKFILAIFRILKFFLPFFSSVSKKKLIIKDGSNDQHILLLLDANWNDDIWHHIEKLKQNGCYVTGVLYDLIPFKHPEHFKKITRETFIKWWSKAPNHLNSVLCISKTVREEFIDWQIKNSSKLNFRIDSSKVSNFKLGANFILNDTLINTLSSELPFYIMVGSIEPRKNHNFVIDAFEVLWRKKYNVGLIIVGNNTWHSELLIKRIKNHREFNNKIFLFLGDVTDRELFFLYRTSKGLIMASNDEGFGLPIAEARALKVRVLCSDIPIFREVGGNYPTFFDLDSPVQLTKSIIKELNIPSNKNKTSKKENNHSISWESASSNLIDKVININL